MRIRKRQPVVLETPRPTLPLLALNSAAEADHLVGQDSCTCCSRQRQLQYWELRKEVEQEDDEPGNRFAGGESVTDNNNKGSLSDARTVEYVRAETPLPKTGKFGECSGNTTAGDMHNSEAANGSPVSEKSMVDDLHVRRADRRSHSVEEILEAEEKEPNLSATWGHLGGFERVRGNEHNIKETGERARVYVSDQLPCSEGDVNHPGNKPKESLLYSLYCVFSKLSGKTVLTAREALSRIIEQRLPGLDQETGLPSVQVAKVMRSNPYFVHLEGGKFFLCSGPSTDSKDEPDSGDALDSENQPSSISPSLWPKIAPLNGFSKAESSKEEQQQFVTSIEVVRKKRIRSKGTVITDEGASDKIECRSRGSKRGGHKTLKSQNSVSHKGKDGVDIGEPICKRYDGRGWKCNEKALDGYSMCRHHHELIVNRLARLRNSGRLGSKKSVKRRKTSIKPVKEVPAAISEGEVAVSSEQNGAHWWKNVKARSLKSINN